MADVLGLLWEYRVAFANGLSTTAQLLLLATFWGTLLGFLLEVSVAYLGSAVRRIVDAMTFCVSAIPALAILFWIHFPLQALFEIVVDPFYTAAVTLTVLNTFSVYRIVADSIKEFPQQFALAAKVTGISHATMVRRIQGPLVFRMALPRWLDQQVVILHSTLFASLISVEEIFRVSQRINSVVYKPVLIYTAMALIFLVTTTPVLWIAKHMRRKAFRDLSER